MPDDSNERSGNGGDMESSAETETPELEGTFPAFAETDLRPRKHG